MPLFVWVLLGSGKSNKGYDVAALIAACLQDVPCLLAGKACSNFCYKI